MSYVIRLDKDGYFGPLPYSSMPMEQAIVFATKKEARPQLNRLRSVHKYPNAEIEPLKFTNK